MINRLFRNCPNCNVEITYKHRYSLNKALKKNSWCTTCHNRKKFEISKYRKCPQCFTDIEYTHHANYTRALRTNSKCYKCGVIECYNNKKDTYRSKRLENKYGITLDDYDKILTNQNNACAICGTTTDKSPKPLFVDHCHTSGKIRGLLCQYCNTGLGHFKDNRINLLKAVDYLSNNQFCV